MKFYILDENKEPKQASLGDTIDNVQETFIEETVLDEYGMRVSTIFLFLRGEFETMIFNRDQKSCNIYGNRDRIYQKRYCDCQIAIREHHNLVKKIKRLRSRNV